MQLIIYDVSATRLEQVLMCFSAKWADQGSINNVFTLMQFQETVLYILHMSIAMKVATVCGMI